MRIAVLAVLLVTASQAQSDPPVYANLDSIRYDGLVFIGGTDRTEYAFLDSIRVVFLVENLTGAEYFWFPFIFCEGAGLGEWWCPTAESPDAECVPQSYDDRRCIIVTRPRVVSILPGLQVFYEGTIQPFHDFVIPRDWSFRRGYVVFDFPYQPPYWKLTVPYTRQDATSVERQSWTTIKLLYR